MDSKASYQPENMSPYITLPHNVPWDLIGWRPKIQSNLISWVHTSWIVIGGSSKDSVWPQAWDCRNSDQLLACESWALLPGWRFRNHHVIWMTKSQLTERWDIMDSDRPRARISIASDFLAPQNCLYILWSVLDFNIIINHGYYHNVSHYRLWNMPGPPTQSTQISKTAN